MNPPVRLIVSDLDGTLLRSDRTISDRTRKAVAAATDAGILFAIATARHPETAGQFAAEAGITGLAICTNGAIVYDLVANAVVFRQTLPASTAASIARYMRAESSLVSFALLCELEHACEPQYAALAEFHEYRRFLGEARHGDIFSLLDRDPTKLMMRHPTQTPAELLALLAQSGIDGHEASWSGAPFVDVVGPGVSKASGLQRLCEMRGIDRSEVVAFGDALNDIPMLQWAGRGIATANAFPEVLSAVSERTLTNDEDGVAIAIERLVLDLLGR